MPESREAHVIGQVKRVGNSLAVFIPADEARRAGISEGSMVEVDVRPRLPPILGMLKRETKSAPFRRAKDMGYEDRI